MILPPDTVYLDAVKAKIRYKQIFVHDTLLDTILETRPFIASMDTTVNCTTLKLEYHFPENNFQNIHVISCPDTVVVQDTVISNTTVTPSFWEDAKKYGIGFLGGFVVGSIAR